MWLRGGRSVRPILLLPALVATFVVMVLHALANHPALAAASILAIVVGAARLQARWLRRGGAEAHLLEAELAGSQDRFRSVAEAAPMMVWTSDTDGHCDYLNKQWYEFTGRSEADELGDGWATGVHPEDIETCLQTYRVALVERRPFEMEYRLRRRDGEYRWLVDKGAPRFAQGMFVGFAGVCVDVTEQRRTADALAANEQRMRMLVEGTDVIVWEYDPQNATFLYVSPQAARLGHSLDEWLRPGFFESLVHPDDRQGVLQSCAAATQQGLNHRMQYRVTAADGTIAWIDDVVSVESMAGGRRRLRGVFLDITLQKQAEAQVREVTRQVALERERLGMALSGGDLGLWDWNPETGEVHFDDRWLAMLGETADTMAATYQEWAARLHPEDVAATLLELERHFSGASPLYEATFRMRHSSGSWCWIQAHGKVVARGSQGQPVRMVGTHLDVTRQKERELQLATLRDAAESASRAKTEFLANMSHEIRTPLTAILGYADMLKHDPDMTRDADRCAHALDTILNAGEHLLTVINDVLDLSKIEAGRMTVEQIEADVASLLVEVEDVMRTHAEGKGVTLTTVIEGAIPRRIRSDPTRFRQILMNVVGNAAKFTEQGSIRVRAMTRPDGGLRVLVEDTGPGMTEDQITRLFSPFCQADTTVTRRFGGTGLGLTISRRLAGLMGGDVTLAWSKPGEGTCFAIDLPVVRVQDDAEMIDNLDPLRQRVVAPRPAEVRLSGRILLAEDGPVNQRLVKAMLGKAGAQVDVANNGLEALAALERAAATGVDYDLLITDIQMPLMDGYSLASTLRERGSGLAIVALTAHAMTEDRQRCLDAGCDDYCSKPIQRALLLATCERWMGRIGGRQDAHAGVALAQCNPAPS